MDGWRVRLKASRFDISDLHGLDGIQIADTIEKVQAIEKRLWDEPTVAIDVETVGCDPRKQHPVGTARVVSLQLGFSAKPGTKGGESVFVPHWGAYEGLLRPLRKWMQAEGERKKVGHNIKYDMHALSNHGIIVAGVRADTMVQDFCFDSGAMSHGLKECVTRYFGRGMPSFADSFGQPKVNKNGTVSKAKGAAGIVVPKLTDVVRTSAGIKTLVKYATRDVVETILLEGYLEAGLAKMEWRKDRSYLEYYRQFEAEFTEVLFKMEQRGAIIDVPYFEEMGERMVRAQKEVEIEFVRACVAAGVSPTKLTSFNMGSPKQVGELLLSLGCDLPRTPTGLPQTTDDALQEVLDPEMRPIINVVLTGRNLGKLLGTYVEPLTRFAKASKDGRVRTGFRQIGTACLAAGELVMTSRGYVAAEDVRVGDEVLTHEGRKRCVTWAGENAVTRIYRVELANGLVLRTTPNHGFYVGEGRWVQADALREGDGVCVQADAERWRRVRGWRDFSVSSWGRVFNRKTERVMSQHQRSKWGHLSVTLRRNGEQKRGENLKDYLVHKLVMRAFGSSRPFEGAEIRHLDGVSFNNTISNLRWGTSAENKEDARRTGANLKRGTKEAKLTEEEARLIRDTPRTRGSDGRWASLLGVSRELVREVRCGRRWRDRHENERKEWPTSKVVSITIEPSEMTYGMTVEEDHSHVTGGVVTHNTMRLSSALPNLQNLPTKQRDKFGIRKGFIAPDGEEVGDIDLSQIEMRLMAHFTGDRKLVEAFEKGWDTHGRTAIEVFSNVKAFVGMRSLSKELLEEVKKKFPDERQNSKTINFGIGYGMGPGRYAKMTGSTEEEGRAAIDRFFRAYPELRDGIKAVQNECRRTGHIRTILGRWLRIPGIDSSVMGIRKRAERQAFNYKVQGSAADMLKMAMILVERDSELRKNGSQMILQIHDELLFYVPKGARERVKGTIEKYVSSPNKVMGFKDLKVPTPADLGFGGSWDEAKEAA